MEVHVHGKKHHFSLVQSEQMWRLPPAGQEMTPKEQAPKSITGTYSS